jgi:phosphatidylglycerophosphatase A
VKRLLASCFGLGYLPLAPGTWGSLPPAIVFALICRLGPSAQAIVLVILALLGCFVCVMFAPAVIAQTGKPDPSQVVADEFSGQAITFLAAVFFNTQVFPTSRVWLTALAGFLLFRIFDIAKPWPCRLLERLPLGWGILADDLMASVYAAISLAICLKLWIAQ